MSTGQSYSEEILDGRLVVHVNHRQRRTSEGFYSGAVIDIGSIENRAGSMALTPLELAALLDGPLERALEKANRE